MRTPSIGAIKRPKPKDYPFKHKGYKYSVNNTGAAKNDRGQSLWRWEIYYPNGDIPDWGTERGATDRDAHIEAKRFIEENL